MVVYQFRKKRGSRLPCLVRYERKTKALGVRHLGPCSKPLSAVASRGALTRRCRNEYTTEADRLEVV